MDQYSKSPFIVHWTGRDIDSELSLSQDLSKKQRKKYIERLLGTLVTGLWLTKGSDVIATTVDKLLSTTPRVCFTEVLLSRVASHAARYGRMGLGFTREFILSQNGSPVIYVNDRTSETVLNSLMAVYKRLGALNSMLEDVWSTVEHFTQVEALEAYDILNHLFAFVKPMSDSMENDFVFYEEAEWRICWHHNAFAMAAANIPSPYDFRRTRQTRCEKWEPPPNLAPSGKPTPSYYLRFSPDDLAILILPDKETRDALWVEKRFRQWFDGNKSAIPLVTLPECVSF